MPLSMFRGTGGGNAFFEWRVGAFFLGAALGLAGIFLDVSWLLTASLVVLLGGVALRRFPSREPASEQQERETPAP